MPVVCLALLALMLGRLRFLPFPVNHRYMICISFGLICSAAGDVILEVAFC